MSSQDIINLCEKKNQIQDLLQDVFNEYNRMNEVRIQNNCEKDLEMRGMSDTIRSLETSEKEKIDEIRNLKKVICDYETIINDLNSKFESLEEDKKEENRFDMIRIQANEITEKDREIERLNGLLKHYKKKNTMDDKEKINTVLNKVKSSNVSEITLTEVDQEVDKETGESNPNFIYHEEQPDEEQDTEQREEQPNEQDTEQREEQPNEQDTEQREEQPNEQDTEQREEPEEEQEEQVDKGSLIIVTSKKIKYYAYENEVPQTVYEFNGKKLAENPLGTRMKNEKGKYRVQLFTS
jgi:hypothetical protein